MATQSINISVNTTVANESKVKNLFASIAYMFESYFGPMNVEVLNPEHRSKLSREDKANVDATMNGIGTF
jgi:hypothetical protein